MVLRKATFEGVKTGDFEEGFDSMTPEMTIAQLIEEALKETFENSLNLSEICQYISCLHPEYKLEGKGSESWKNLVQQNLKINDAFVELHRKNGISKNGSYWKLSNIPVDNMKELIAEALSNAPEGNLLISEICQSISQLHPYYKMEGRGQLISKDSISTMSFKSNFFLKFTSQIIFGSTGTPPITLFFGAGKIYCVIGKTMSKEDLFSTK